MNPETYLAVMALVCFGAFFGSILVNRKKIQTELAVSLKQDISYEQMRDAEKRVADFLARNNITPGAGIVAIGNALHICAGQEDAHIAGQAHLSRPDADGKMVVTFQKGLSPQGKAFAFAHECGHIMNNDGPPIDRPDGKHKSEGEQLADYVAAALLMPLEDVYDYLTANHFQTSTPKNKIRITKSLCKRYGVSEMIALRRIREVYALKLS